MPDVVTVIDTLARHADNPSAYLALNADTCHFDVPSIDGVIAYRNLGRRHIAQFGGVFAAPEDQPALLEAFLNHAREQRKSVISVQLMRSDAELYARHGFTVNQLGADYARSLEHFSLAGKKFVPLRNKISRAKRAGVTVGEVGVDDAAPEDLEGALAGVDRVWLRAKGRHVKPLSFMVGELGGPGGAARRLFVARGGAGEILAYISFSPVYGPRSGWLHDLSRKVPDAPPGVLETIVVFAVERFRAEGVDYLHFGFTPFTGLDPANEVTGRSGIVSRVVRLLADHGASVYPAADQLAYKEKWGLDTREPEYVAFQGGVTPGKVWSLLRVTNIA